MKFIEDHLLNRDHQECSEESKVHVRDYARLVQNAEQHSKMYTLRRAREARIRPGKSLSRQNLPLPLSSARRREISTFPRLGSGTAQCAVYMSMYNSKD